MYKFTPI